MCRLASAVRAAGVMLAPLLLAGCLSDKPASVAGECKAFRDPGFAVRGARAKDQGWINRTQETGIAICGWERPPDRPAANDATGKPRRRFRWFGS